MLRRAQGARSLRLVVPVRVAVSVHARTAAASLPSPGTATTFSSPGGWRCSPARGQRDSGCRGEGGARERRRPQCASSFLGEERATLSSRSPRDCSPDVTPPPTPRKSGAEGGVRGVRVRECEQEWERARVRVCVCECARESECASQGWGPVGTAAGSCEEPEIELPANRRREAAVNSGGRWLPGWGGNTTDADSVTTKGNGLTR